MTSAKQCPCGSGALTKLCCRPYHRGENYAKTPQELVRSRYSAFALGETDYLLRTLSMNHADRHHGEDKLRRAFKATSESLRFMGMHIMDVALPSGPDSIVDQAQGRVLFLAKLFRKGMNLSFVEDAQFVIEEGRWTYLHGRTLEWHQLPKDIEQLRFDVFDSQYVLHAKANQ